MQRNQIITYVRTFGLMVGALLFVFVVFRSGQSASREVAVKGKPFLWNGVHTQVTTEAYTAFSIPDISPAIAVQQASASTDTPTTTSSEKPKPANKDKDIAKQASNAVENSTRDIHASVSHAK